MLLNLSNNFSMIIFLIVFIWLSAITFLLVRLTATFSRLTKGASDKDLKELLESLMNDIKDSQKAIVILDKDIRNIQSESLYFFQKSGFVRYNPFSETGGNQSFVLSLLDGKDNGFVITSLHSREATRIFAKPVKEGKEDGYEFSKEELQAVTLAIKRKNS